jgi:phage I-like protein
MRSTATALLAAALALQGASAAVLLVPAGEFRGFDGRPKEVLTWQLSDTAGQLLADKLNARHAGHVEFNFDYEHQAMHAPQNGMPAPASGWAKQFEWRSGQGLFAINTQWTTKAKAHIDADEYRYISPVIVYDKKTGVVTDVLNAALVARPNLDMQGVANAQLATQLSALNAHLFNDPRHQEQSMNLAQQLRAALGLPDAADDAAIVAAVAANAASAQAAQGQHTALCAALGVDTSQTQAQVVAAALNAKTQAGLAGSSTTAMAALQAQVAALETQNRQREVDGMVTAALSAGKLLPAQVPWAKEAGMADPKFLSGFIATAPVIAAALSQQQSAHAGTQGAADGAGKGAAGLDATQLAMCSALDIKPEDFAKTLASQAAKA